MAKPRLSLNFSRNMVQDHYKKVEAAGALATELEPVLTALEQFDRKEKIFYVAPNDAVAPGYSQFVQTPMAFEIMRANLERKSYDDKESFVRDFMLIVTNAMAYNTPNSYVFLAAFKLLREGRARLLPIVSNIGDFTDAKILEAEKLTAKKSHKKRQPPVLAAPSPSAQVVESENAREAERPMPVFGGYDTAYLTAAVRGPLLVPGLPKMHLRLLPSGSKEEKGDPQILSSETPVEAAWRHLLLPKLLPDPTAAASGVAGKRLSDVEVCADGEGSWGLQRRLPGLVNPTPLADLPSASSRPVSTYDTPLEGPTLYAPQDEARLRGLLRENAHILFQIQLFRDWYTLEELAENKRYTSLVGKAQFNLTQALKMTARAK